MRTSRFTDEQTIGIVREYEAGGKLTNLCRRHNVKAAWPRRTPSGCERSRRRTAG